jgi:integrase/recombinase XerD
MPGHESSRTTKIYTQLTTKGFEQQQSPADKLDLKEIVSIFIPN